MFLDLKSIAYSKMTEKEFCEIETLYSGEPIDKIGQLQKATFTGKELKEYIEFAIKHLEKRKKKNKSMTRGETSNFKGGKPFEYDFQEKVRKLKKIKCISCKKEKFKRHFYGSKGTGICIDCR